jgi:hypothetical protein
MSDYNLYNGISTSNNGDTLPYQMDSLSVKKTDKWKRNTLDFLYNKAKKQIRQNLVFVDVKRMTEGDFVVRSVDIEKTLYGDEAQQLKKLTNDVGLPTHLKNFDILGMMVHAIESVFGELDDKYRAETTDEIFTNQFIEEKTKRLHKNIEQIIQLLVKSTLIENGLDPDKQDFQSEEERQQYQQQIEAEIQKINKEDIEGDLAKNFKVIATEWANNVLVRDSKHFNLLTRDKNRLADYIRTGRWFRHYRAGYDYYDIEDWNPEEVFFSQNSNTEFPQDCEYIGRLTAGSITDIIAKFGHLMTSRQQEIIGNYWGTKGDYKKDGSSLTGGVTSESGLPFATNYIVPFENYFDHQVNTQMEDYLGSPLAKTTHTDANGVSYEERHWMPRAGSFDTGTARNYAQYYRNDIQVTNSQIEYMETYWTSFEKTGILIYKNELGVVDIKQVTEDLMGEFIQENNIKVKSNVSLNEMQEALRDDDLEQYVGTLSWQNLPKEYYGVLIKSGNSFPMKEDMILWAKPMEQQITGKSNYFETKKPIGGYIGKSPIIKSLPYQQLYNICLNQISELMADEPGTFFSLDINAIPSEYKTDENTEEGLFNLMDTIKLTKLLPLNLSRSNMEGNVAYPNVFQRNEVIFASQVQYRQQMAEYFKQQAFAQLGVTQQLLGQMVNFETATGTKQNAVYTNALITSLLDDFISSKVFANEIHIAVAQIAESSGKIDRKMTNTDGMNVFIDIMAEDGEYFPLRKIGVSAASNSKDRPIVRYLQEMLISDNTIQKDFSDIVDIVTNPYSLKLRQIAREMRTRTDQKTQEERQFQDAQQTKQIEANAAEQQKFREHELAKIDKKGEWDYKAELLTAVGRDSASTKEDNIGDILSIYDRNLKQISIEQDKEVRMQEISRKMNMDESTKNIEAEKLKLKQEELGLKSRQLASQEYIATINKN